MEVYNTHTREWNPGKRLQTPFDEGFLSRYIGEVYIGEKFDPLGKRDSKVSNSLLFDQSQQQNSSFLWTAPEVPCHIVKVIKKPLTA